MTSAQTEALQNYQDAASAYIARCNEFARAFGEEHEDIAIAVGSTAIPVGEQAHMVAAWKAGVNG
jgi:hypothetical protein